MTEKLPPKNDNPTIQTVDDTIKGDGELSYNILYEVQFKQWDLWGSFKNVDVAYITLTNKEDPIILIEKLIYKLDGLYIPQMYLILSHLRGTLIK